MRIREARIQPPQARLAIDSCAFPLFSSDPRCGERLRERLDLRGNPALRDDCLRDRKTFEAVDFAGYTRTERRLAACPAEEISKLRVKCLSNWRRLPELAGLR